MNMYSELDVYDLDQSIEDSNDLLNQFNMSLESLRVIEDHSEILLDPNVDILTLESMSFLGNDLLYTDEYLSLESDKWNRIKSGAMQATSSAARAVGTGALVAGKEGSKIIARSIVKGWDLSREYYNKSFVSIDDLHKEVRKLKERIDKATNMSVSDSTVKLRREAVTLSLDYSMPNSASDVIKALEAITDDSQYILNDWTNSVKSVGDDMFKSINKFDKDDPKKTLVEMISHAKKLNFDAVQRSLKMRSAKIRTLGNTEAYMGNPLPGNLAIYSLRPDLIGKGNTLLEESKLLRRRSLKLMKLNSNRRNNDSGTTINTLNIDELKDVCDACFKLIEVLEKYSRSGLNESIEKTGRLMQRRVDKTYIAITDRTHVAYGNGVYHFTSAYLHWGGTINKSMISQSIAAIRASIMVCSRSLSNYNN